MPYYDTPKTNDDFSKLQNYLFIGGAVLALVPVGYLSYNIVTLHVHAMPIYLLVMLAGLVTEYSKINPIKLVLSSVLIAFFISLFPFLFGFGEKAAFIQNMQSWPYLFFYGLILTMLLRHQNSFILKVGEGLVMLQSLAITYWIINLGPVIFTDGPLRTLAVLIAFPVIFSLYHAFTDKPITPIQKLLLSVWSAIVFLYFGLTNASELIGNTNLIPDLSAMRLVFITIQYFLLGISSVYIAKSLIMITGFFRGKNEGAGSYNERVRALTVMHISRVEDAQIKRAQSIVLILFSFLIFGLNYFLQIVPASFAIWLVFISYPLVLLGHEKVALRRVERK